LVLQGYPAVPVGLSRHDETDPTGQAEDKFLKSPQDAATEELRIMSSVAARSRLKTHSVENQPPPFCGHNLYLTDLALREAVQREAGDWLEQRAAGLGAVAGSEQVLRLGEEANRHPPELVSYDRYGRALDEVRFHPSYHSLLALAMEHRIHDLPWTVDTPVRHLGHAVLLAIFSQAEAGTMCPIDMTYAAVPTLRAQPDVAAPWLERLIGGRYDPLLRPISEKSGVTLGMAMTEKQGGSDVRANTTRAQPLGGQSYALVGHKWFCSAPMSDGFLTLAQTAGGLSCFLVPRVTPTGERNAIQLVRLKDKLGNRSNASAEIEYQEAFAWRIGEEGQGVKVIIDMVQHTRLGTLAGTVGLMRRALVEAVNHVAGRRAFQKTLIDQPVMRTVVADLALEYEAAAVLTVRVARLLGEVTAEGRALARLAVALGKYLLTKRCPNFVYECLECHGGVGYVEETPMPRLFRESPLNAIWEGSGNVIALDVLRTLAREPVAVAAYAAEVASAKGGDAGLDRAAASVLDRIRKPVEAAGARWLCERMALLLQGALLVRNAPRAVADAFCRRHFGSDRDDVGITYGALPSEVDVAAIVHRQLTF
jgi:putative acyl-CoA dehydrogenase